MDAPPPAAPRPAWRGEEAPAAGPLQLLAYGPSGFHESAPATVAEARPAADAWNVAWLNVNGLRVEAARELEAAFGLHPLALEDAMKKGQRPKVEDHGEYVFVVVQMADLDGVKVHTEQLAVFIGKRFLVTVQERAGDVFDVVRSRIRQGHPALMAGGPDRLAHQLLDAIVDAYFPLMEDLGDRLERMEDEVVETPGPDTLQRVQDYKRQLVSLRRVAWPQRETFAMLHHGDLSTVRKETRPFFRDVHDHTVVIMDLLETYRERAADVTDLYLSSVNQRTNEVVKVLTMISTIFIPLTFITSVYGMNFDTSLPGNMPELHAPYGYVAVLSVMLVISLALLVFFRRRGWI